MTFKHFQIHLRIHLNERKFKCEECGVAFMQKEFLARHKLTHSGEVPFRCDMCGRAFRQLVNLKQHTLRKHFNNNNNKVTRSYMLTNFDIFLSCILNFKALN